MEFKITGSGVDDHASAMKSMVDNVVHSNPNWDPHRVMLEAKKELGKLSSTWIGMSDTQDMSRAKHARCQSLGKDAFRLMEEPHAGKMKDSKFWFLQLSMVAPNPDANELERVASFGSP